MSVIETCIELAEKMYRVVEECIKALAQHYNMPEHEVAIKEGMWTSYS
ncbi:MAG: PaREP1 family protein [archaeon YNP-WB-062]|nr:PaREP1 family protein [Candidatus Culexarchaeum yellowstonense]